MALVDSLISAGSGMTGAAITAGTSAIIDKRNRDFQVSMYNKQLADQREDVQRSRDWQEEMYNKYDSPAAKYAQMSALGINPNTIADMLGEGIGISPSVPASNPAPSVPSTPMSYLGQSVGNLASEMLSSVKVGAEIEKLRQESQSLAIENKYKDEQQELSIEQARILIDKHKSEIDKYVSETQLNDAQKKSVYEVLPYLAQKSEAELDQISKVCANYVEATKKIKHEIGVLDAQRDTERHKQRNLDASSELLGQQSKTEKERSEVEYYNKRLKILDEQLTDVRNQYEKDMYEHGLDPSKISYDLNNPTGIAIGAIQMVRYKRDHKN